MDLDDIVLDDDLINKDYFEVKSDLENTIDLEDTLNKIKGCDDKNGYEKTEN